MFHKIKKVLAIVCVTMAVGAVTIPNFVSAQTSTPDSTSRPERRKPHDGGIWKKLNLTDAQKSQLKTIHENAKTQRQSVFTPEQRAIMEQARQSGDRKGVGKSLNLTDAQKQQLKTISQNTRTQVENVLTSEQNQQLAQFRQDRKAQYNRRRDR
ncbi:MAG: Spy/CpxP family protein refolding chaperone [Pseudanabaena sp.]